MKALPYRYNAARLAACWNACDGMRDPVGDVAALRESNAELLDALERLLDTNQNAFRRARSAVAKAKGVAYLGTVRWITDV